jgi:8-oxo-dGTP diphosphatase
MDERLLLVKTKGTDYSFLPGGHIEFCEKAEAALLREVKEELGKSAKIIKFLGAIEHQWLDDDVNNHEVNSLFRIDIDGLGPNGTPLSQEAQLQFFWVNISDIESHNVRPASVVGLVKNLDQKDSAFWDSTL